MNTYFHARESCPLCHSSNFHVLHHEPYSSPALHAHLEHFYTNQGIFEPWYLEGAEYQICECGDCGLLFQKETPGDVLSERIYEHWISPEYALALEKAKMDLREYLNFVADFTAVAHYLGKPLRELSVFDFGMGWGTTLQIYQSMGCKVFGCEISESRIAYTAGKGITNLKLEELPRDRFDYIHVYQVMEHISDPLEVLGFLVDSLSPDGLIRLTVPNAQCAKQDIPTLDWTQQDQRIFRLAAIDPLEHINSFSYHTLKLLGEKCGLEPVSLRLPLKHMTPYQLFRKYFRGLYHRIKHGAVGRTTDIVFQKKS